MEAIPPFSVGATPQKVATVEGLVSQSIAVPLTVSSRLALMLL